MIIADSRVGHDSVPDETMRRSSTSHLTTPKDHRRYIKIRMYFWTVSLCSVSFNPLSVGDVFIRQNLILTYKDDHRTEIIKVFIMAVDP